MRISEYTKTQLLSQPINRSVLSSKASVLAGRLDSVSISTKAKNLSKNQRAGGKSSNRQIDGSVDLQGYIDKAKYANNAAIANAGNEIMSNNHSVYSSEVNALREALTEKYTKLVQEAKSHAEPEMYIRSKYYDTSSSFYISDLTDEERQAAFNNEISILKTGHTRGVDMRDSLFRGISLQGEATSANEKEFNRRMVNAQINTILSTNGISLSDNKQISFSVDPYDYRITLDGTGDFDLKNRIEQALNVGENGKQLFNHIRSSARGNGITSSQVTEEGTLKYELYHETQRVTGLDISLLTERDGSYYTESGEDIIELYNKSLDTGIENGTFKIPDTHISSLKEQFAEMVHSSASRGWNNLMDMVLSIDYNNKGLHDKYQNVGFGAGDLEWLYKLNARQLGGRRS